MRINIHILYLLLSAVMLTGASSCSCSSSDTQAEASLSPREDSLLRERAVSDARAVTSAPRGTMEVERALFHINHTESMLRHSGYNTAADLYISITDSIVSPVVRDETFH